MTLKEVISIANPTTYYGDPVENRTPVSSVRGSCPRPLDDGAILRVTRARTGFFLSCLNSNWKIQTKASKL